jgi:hypothetical protein
MIASGYRYRLFFDDAVHALLGIEDTRWQALYHFTLGGPLDDARLQERATVSPSVTPVRN